MEIGDEYFSESEQQLQESQEFTDVQFNHLEKESPESVRVSQIQTPDYPEVADQARVQIPQLHFQKMGPKRQNQMYPSFNMMFQTQDLERDNTAMIQDHLISNMNESSFYISDTNENTMRQLSVGLDQNRQMQLQLSNGSNLVSSLSQGLSEQLSNIKSDIYRMQQENQDIKTRLSNEKPILVQDYLMSQRLQGSQHRQPLQDENSKPEGHVSEKQRNQRKQSKANNAQQERVNLVNEFEVQKEQLQDTIEKKNRQIRKEKEINIQLKAGYETSLLQVMSLQQEILKLQSEKQDLQSKLTKSLSQHSIVNENLEQLTQENRRLHETIISNRGRGQSSIAFDLFQEQMLQKDSEITCEKEKSRYKEQRIQNLLDEINQMESIIRDKDLFIHTMQESYDTERQQFQHKLLRYQNILLKLNHLDSELEINQSHLYHLKSSDIHQPPSGDLKTNIIQRQIPRMESQIKPPLPCYEYPVKLSQNFI